MPNNKSKVQVQDKRKWEYTPLLYPFCGAVHATRQMLWWNNQCLIQRHKDDCRSHFVSFLFCFVLLLLLLLFLHYSARKISVRMFKVVHILYFNALGVFKSVSSYSSCLQPAVMDGKRKLGEEIRTIQ